VIQCAILKVLHEIELVAESDVINCPCENMDRLKEQRLMLEGCRKTLRAFQAVLDRYSNDIGSE